MQSFVTLEQMVLAGATVLQRVKYKLRNCFTEQEE
jgi:hypothetical protein